MLTGVFGEGELGPVRQPRHPHSLALARLLLHAGADPNDGQALYNRMFEPDNDHLELLFEFGLGTGDGGPWRRRLGDALDTPAEMLRGELAWAITHGLTERVRLLVSHGVDVTSPFERGATATSMAATTGHADLVDYLVAHGAPPLGLDPAEAFVAAVLAPEIGSDRASLDRLLGEHPGLAAQVRSARPALITWAAACGRPEAAEILAGLGFDVNAMGRTDVPSDQPWQTALHKAAEDGNLELARTLLRLGADPDLRDHRFDSTPLGWARYFGQQPLIDLLEPLTAPDPQEGPPEEALAHPMKVASCWIDPRSHDHRFPRAGIRAQWVSFEVSADAYLRFMGQYSEPLAVQFADLAEVRPGQRLLDVGLRAGRADRRTGAPDGRGRGQRGGTVRVVCRRGQRAPARGRCPAGRGRAAAVPG